MPIYWSSLYEMSTLRVAFVPNNALGSPPMFRVAAGSSATAHRQAIGKASASSGSKHNATKSLSSRHRENYQTWMAVTLQRHRAATTTAGYRRCYLLPALDHITQSESEYRYKLPLKARGGCVDFLVANYSFCCNSNTAGPD